MPLCLPVVSPKLPAGRNTSPVFVRLAHWLCRPAHWPCCPAHWLCHLAHWLYHLTYKSSRTVSCSSRLEWRCGSCRPACRSFCPDRYLSVPPVRFVVRFDYCVGPPACITAPPAFCNAPRTNCATPSPGPPAPPAVCNSLPMDHAFPPPVMLFRLPVVLPCLPINAYRTLLFLSLLLVTSTRLPLVCLS